MIFRYFKLYVDAYRKQNNTRHCHIISISIPLIFEFIGRLSVSVFDFIRLPIHISVIDPFKRNHNCDLERTYYCIPSVLNNGKKWI